MFELGKLCYLCLVLFCAGDFLNALLFKKAFRENAAMRFALAYGLGAGAITLLAFCLSWAGIRLTFAAVGVCAAPFIPLCWYYSFVKYPAAFASPHAGEKPGSRLSHYLSVFFSLCIISSLAIVAFRALFLPMHLPDETVQWCIRAKIIFAHGTVFAGEFFEPYRTLYHTHYPVMVPLLESLVFMALGAANDTFAKLPFPVFFAALLAFFYAAQRRFASRRHALLFTAMLAVVPVFIRDVTGNPSSGYADIPLSFFYFIAVVSLCSWLGHRRQSDLLLAAAAIVFAVFTKKEGSVLWCILLGLSACMLVLKDRRVSRDAGRLAAVFGLVPLLAHMPWAYFKAFLPPPPWWEQDFGLANFTAAFLLPKFSRLPVLFEALFRTMFSLKSYNLVWILFFAGIVLAWRKAWSFPRRLLLAAVFCNITAVFIASLVYPHSWWHNFPADMPRLLMFNTPLLLYFISLQAYSANSSCGSGDAQPAESR